MQLCAQKGIHLISDEIYALSVFERKDRESEVFTSVLSIDTEGLIDPNLVHVLYGMSKVSRPYFENQNLRPQWALIKERCRILTRPERALDV